MTTVFVKPIAGALIRTPQTLTPLPENGAMVSLDGEEGKFWRRRLNDGSVFVSTPPEAASAIIDTTESASRTERGGRNK